MNLARRGGTDRNEVEEAEQRSERNVSATNKEMDVMGQQWIIWTAGPLVMSKINRPLAKGINWDAETIALQNIDWENNVEEFNRLVLYVKHYLVEREFDSEQEIFAKVSKDEFEQIVRKAAGEYKDRFGSLAFWCFERTKFFLRSRTKAA
jgi:hypothetical protein